MIAHLKNTELIEVINDIFYHHYHKMSNPQKCEVFAAESHKVRSSQFKFLNRHDLAKILYGMLGADMLKIDTCPVEDLPLLVNEEWMHPLLLERVKNRLRDGACVTAEI